MIFWFWTSGVNAVECPKSDLYAYKLDAYTIELGEQQIQFRMVVKESSVIQPEVELWAAVLTACNANGTLGTFTQWQGSWNSLENLGVQYQTAKWKQKFQLRKDIRNLEREIVIQYAEMLHHLELETGISVLWNVEEYPLAKGMVSAGRGSPKVYQYIFTQYNHVQYQ